jgi:hypothetical protein
MNTGEGITMMSFEEMNRGRKERMLRELASDLADLVRSGDLTDNEANEWMVSKQDQWFGGDR